jgi:hypothetical protein
VAVQAYKEVREDGHPVMIVAAVDIARIMRAECLELKEK